MLLGRGIHRGDYDRGDVIFLKKLITLFELYSYSTVIKNGKYKKDSRNESKYHHLLNKRRAKPLNVTDLTHIVHL